MKERAIFMEVLDRDTPADRAAFLDEVCAGDPAIRKRVEALLRSHEEAGEFPGKLAPQRLADEFAARESGDTRTGPSGPDSDEKLDFLEPSDKPGSLGRLGHYEVQEVIGRGGMGVVLKAVDEKLHRVVAVKVMAPQLATNATARKRFAREARAAAAVRNDHVVAIHGVEDAGPLPYLVMEFVDGPSLQDRLDRGGPLQVTEVLRIGMQAATGLAAAHAQGLIHRDVKPSNILLENGVERVKLTDFGLARAVDDASLTQSGTVSGTPQYMSPEQARGEATDHRGDLFSLGSVLYAMCTGRAPFRASGTLAVLKRVCESEPRSIREVAPEIPDWLIAVIAKLQAKTPADRYQSAVEVAELLGGCLAHVQQPALIPLPSRLAGLPLTGMREEHAKAKRRPHRRARVAAVLFALLAGLGVSEAVGVTRLRAAIVRLVTPAGTLIVAVEDPALKVSLGAGDVAGPQHGQPDTQAFVLLGGNGNAERKCATLAEAVQRAGDGDTIEVRGNGPFVSDPVIIRGRSLTIRAGVNFRPVLKLRSEGMQATDRLLEALSPLVVEGLEFHHMFHDERVSLDGPYPEVIHASDALRVANCRFLTKKGTAIVSEGPLCETRNCEFICCVSGFAVSMTSPVNRLVIDNSLLTESPVVYHPEAALVQLSHNTFGTRIQPLWLFADLSPGRRAKGGDPPVKALRIEAVGNVFDPGCVLLVLSEPSEGVLPTGDWERVLANLMGWKGEWNLFVGDGPLVALAKEKHYPGMATKDLAGWRRFWGTAEASSIRGTVRYHDGAPLAKTDLSPEKVTPEDFRLLPNSAGYQAGKDGKDLGADVDLVGPGPAYERWKKTPAYPQWLKETGQIKK